MCDYFVNQKNIEIDVSGKHLMRQGDNLNYDNLMHHFNTKVRVAVSNYLFNKGSEKSVKETFDVLET